MTAVRISPSQVKTFRSCQRLWAFAYVDGIRRNLPGDIRLGKLNYRALWIEPESSPDEILAYAERNYRSLFLKDGFIVLRLDGRVKWMGKQQFRTLLAEQQSPMEIQMLRK